MCYCVTVQFNKKKKKGLFLFELLGFFLSSLPVSELIHTASYGSSVWIAHQLHLIIESELLLFEYL